MHPQSATIAMEQLLHYIWKHRLLPLTNLTTTDGRPVEVIDPGLHNRNAGPDFFNAKVKIDGTLWVGNVEIHDRASDWYQHSHDHDPKYDNVVLHVCVVIDREVRNSAGHYVPQLQLSVPQQIRDNYDELQRTDQYPPCYRIIPSLSQLTVHSWMAALQTERLERKTADIRRRAELCGGSWEDAYFVTLARSYGFGINSDAFEQWALNMPLKVVGHHSDDLFQIEALFMGQAGLLAPNAIHARHREEALADGYLARLRNEYLYLAHKFQLKPIDASQWNFLRLRPQNFPHIRLSQLATLYYTHKAGLSQLLECQSVTELKVLLSTHVTPYWETHYSFGSPSAKSNKSLSQHSLELLTINTAIPVLFAVGRHRRKEELCDRAFDLLEQLKPEKNHIISMWKECGLPVQSAGDSQALIQLKREYCDRRDCLRCRFGYEYLRHAKPQK